RKPDAAEAALEAVLAAATPTQGASGRFVPSVEMLEELLERGKASLEGKETPLLLLAQARVAYFAGDEEVAEKYAHKARKLSEESNHREWAGRAAALEALLFEAAGKRTRAQRATQDAVEILEDIGARLPQDLREVYWSEERRRALRGSLE